MPLFKGSLLLGGGKEGAGSLAFDGVGRAGLQPVPQVGGQGGHTVPPEHRFSADGGAAGHHQFGVGRDEDLVLGQTQTLGKNPHQHRVEGQGSALEHHGAGDLQPLGQAADGLFGDGVEGRQGQVRLGHPLVEQGLNVGFGVDAAPAGDIIDTAALFRQGVELLHRDLEQRGNLVDEGAGAAGAAAVHPHVGHGAGTGGRVGLEKDHLGVLAAQLDGAAHLLVAAAQSGGVGRHLLGEGQVQRFGDGLGTRTGQADPEGLAGKMFCQRIQHTQDAVHLVGVMTLVFRVEDFAAVRRQHGHLGGGGTDVDAGGKALGIVGLLCIQCHVCTFFLLDLRPHHGGLGEGARTPGSARYAKFRLYPITY